MNTANPVSDLPRIRPAVAQAVVEALHDIAAAVAEAMNEFSDPIDKALLRDALQDLTDVAIVHDDLGGYGVYSAFGSDTDDLLGERS